MSGLPLNIARLSRSCRGAARLALVAVLALVAPSASAAPAKDAAAEKALKDAMDNDYFETRFDRAESKLRAAIEACGTGCSEPMKAKLYVALGTVLAGGRKELDDAQDAFVEALKLDPTAAPDPDLATAQVQFAYEKAKATLKLGPNPGGAATASPAVHTSPPSQRVRTPVPLYVDVMPTTIADVRKVTGSYASPGSNTFSPLDFRKIGDRGYGSEVPCDDVAREGDLRYFITILGEKDRVIASFGSKDEPLKVPIRATAPSDPPHWPGFTAPEQCSSRNTGPSQCLDDKQCNAGLVCRAGECVTPPTTSTSNKLSNWVTVTFAPDFGLFAAENVCTRVGQNEDKYVCQRSDGSRYVGTPTTNVADNVNFGFVPGTLRVAAQYDRVVYDNFTAGLRLGFAFNGASGDGVGFLPVHVEARIGYSLGKDAFTAPGLRPFAFLGGGLAQVDAPVNVEVLEDANACGADPDDPSSPCTVGSQDGRVEPRKQTLTAYKQAGNGFATVGVGLAYTPIRNVGLHLALRGAITFPVLIGVIAPEAGVTFGF